MAALARQIAYLVQVRRRRATNKPPKANRDTVAGSGVTLADRLKADGLRVWFDEWEIHPGDSTPAKIEDGLEQSRVLVFCMSAYPAQRRVTPTTPAAPASAGGAAVDESEASACVSFAHPFGCNRGFTG
jgi:hypothetical protein